MRRIEAIRNTQRLIRETEYVSRQYTPGTDSQFSRRDFQESMLASMDGLMVQLEHLQNSARALANRAKRPRKSSTLK